MGQSRFQLRSAEAGDLDAVFALFAELQALHHAAEPDFFRSQEKDDLFEEFFNGVLRDPQNHLMLACAGGAAVGYVQYFLGTWPKDLYSVERRVAYIHQLFVSDGYRRTGCASALIDHVKDAAARDGVDLVGIDHWSFNSAARSCFGNAGFKVNQEVMWLRL